MKAETQPTWWFLENADGEWLMNEPFAIFTRDPNEALKWPNATVADDFRRGLRHPLWSLKATEHVWVKAETQPALDLEALRKVAEAALANQPHAQAWGVHLGTLVRHASPAYSEHVATARAPEVAEFIATFDPPTVLRLLSQLQPAPAREGSEQGEDRQHSIETILRDMLFAEQVSNEGQSYWRIGGITEAAEYLAALTTPEAGALTSAYDRANTHLDHLEAGSGVEPDGWLADARPYTNMGRMVGGIRSIVDSDARGLYGLGNYDLKPLYTAPPVEPVAISREEPEVLGELTQTLLMLRKSIDDLQDRRMALENCDHAIALLSKINPDRAQATEAGRPLAKEGDVFTTSDRPSTCVFPPTTGRTEG